MRSEKSDKEHLTIDVPFVFSNAVDPTSLASVGDQVASEHIFAFHARSPLNAVFEGFVSDVEFINDTTVVITPRKDLRYADGSPVGIENIFDAVKLSLEGTSHASHKALLESVNCDGTQIKIVFKSLPINLRELLTLPDFSIFDTAALPIKAGSLRMTGPYKLVSLTNNEVFLEPNLFYPTDLVSNRLPVTFKRYAASESEQENERLISGAPDAAYLYGHAISTEFIEKIQLAGYVTEVFPSEWLIYLTFSSNVPLEIRRSFQFAVREFQDSAAFRESMGEKAFSFLPSDRGFGLADLESFELLSKNPSRLSEPSKKLKLVTLDIWNKMPLFVSILSFIKSRYSEVEIEILPFTEVHRLHTGEFEITLAPMGLSPTDPLTHLNYLSGVNREVEQLVSKESLTKASLASSNEELVKLVHDFESRILVNGTVAPIGHFPGIVAHKNSIKINRNQNFGWGIQAWSFLLD